MAKPALLLAFFILQLTAIAQPLLRYGIDIKRSATNFADTVAIEWENRQMVVPVTVGGRQLRFLFDTGAGSSVVYADAPIVGSKPRGHIASVDALGHRDTVAVVALPPLTIGSVTYSGCQATVQPRPGATRLDGILGFDLLASGLCAKIDTRHRRLILTDRQKLFDDEAAQDVKYTEKYHTPYLRITPFGKYRDEACFDTGSRQYYMLNRQSLAHGEERCSPQVVDGLVEGRAMGRHAMGHSGTEARGEVVFLNLDNLQIGGLALTGLHTLTTQGHSHLGAALLDLAAVIVDTRRQRLRFQPYTAPASQGGAPTVQALPDGRFICHIDNKQTEVAFIPLHGLPAVGLVWPQGVPYRQGFREGDIITAIDGRPVYSFAQFVRWSFERGREYVFTVSDAKSRQRKVKWVRLPL